MEKISRIVRGNSRVAAVDLKNAAPVRPGTPSFGRPVGASTSVTNKTESTASRAVALHNELKELKKTQTKEQVVQEAADQFFMSRIRRPDDEVHVQPTTEFSDESSTALEEAQPSEYTPRGSYVNVNA